MHFHDRFWNPHTVVAVLQIATEFDLNLAWQLISKLTRDYICY